MKGYSRNAAYTAGELEGMTITEMKALAAKAGYSITAGRKADMIQEFLTQQKGEEK